MSDSNNENDDKPKKKKERPSCPDSCPFCGSEDIGGGDDNMWDCLDCGEIIEGE